MSRLEEQLDDIWRERMVEYSNMPLMFITNKTKNPKWRWWKIFTKKYEYNTIFNEKWLKYQRKENN